MSWKGKEHLAAAGFIIVTASTTQETMAYA